MKRSYDITNNIIILLMIFLIIFSVGFRSVYFGQDTLGYMDYFNHVVTEGAAYKFEILFYNVARFFAFLGLSSEFFFTFICCINFFIIYLLMKKNNQLLDLDASSVLSLRRHPERVFARRISGPNDLPALLIFLSCFLMSPFFLATQVNIIRHGVAIFLNFWFYFHVLSIKKRHSGRRSFAQKRAQDDIDSSKDLVSLADLIIGLLIAVISIGFHKTAFLYLLLTPLLFLPYSTVFILVAFLSIIYMLNFSKLFVLELVNFLGINIDNILHYGENYEYKRGVRLDFTAFTLICGGIFFFMAHCFLSKENAHKFLELLKAYWVMTIPFFIFGYAAYSDRYVTQAWVFLSVLSADFIILFAGNFVFFKRFSFYLFLLTAMLFCLYIQRVH